MEPLKILYWSRVGLGIVAALMCALLRVVGGVGVMDDFISGLLLGILFYILTYYILKRRFAPQIEKQSKVLTMGIGVYFMSWIVSWGLFYTIVFVSTQA